MDFINKCFASVRSIFKLISVEPVILLYMCAIFLESSVIQDYIFTKNCIQQLNYSQNESYLCNMINDTHTKALIKESTTNWLKYYNTLLSFSTFLMVPFIGGWSDHFGRKVAMLVPAIGSFFAVLILIILSFFIESPVSLLFIPALISGLSGGIPAMAANCFGTISDITTEVNRSKRIGFLEAMLFLGGTLGYYMGANFIKIFGYTWSLVFELCLHVTIIMYICFFLKSTPLDPDAKIFALSHLKEAFKTVCKKRINRNHIKILFILFTGIFVFYGFSVQMSTLYMFMKDPPLSWAQDKYGQYQSIATLLNGVALLVVLPICYQLFKLSDITVCIIGIVSRSAGLILLSFSNNVLIYFCPVVLMLAELSVPSIRSMLSKLVDKEEKGKIFAMLSIVQNFSYTTGSFLFPTIYAQASSVFHGTALLLVGILQVIPFIILVWLYLKKKLEVPYENFDDPTEPSINKIEQEIIIPPQIV